MSLKKSEQDMVWLTYKSIFLKKPVPKKNLAQRQKPWPGDKNPGLATFYI
jgi:hypothetical protein